MHFQERPWDLFLSEGYVTAIAAAILATGQGVLWAVLLVFFVPGHLLVAALFPRDGEMSWTERLALSLGVSIVILPLLGLLLNFTVGIFLLPVVASVLLFAGAAGAVAYVRRVQLPLEKRLSLSLSLEVPAWRDLSALDKTLLAGLLASVMVSASILTYVVATPQPGDRFTGLGILGPDGLIADYPTDLNVSEEGTVIVEVLNHEFQQVDFLLRVDLVGIRVAWNETAGFNETVEMNRTAMTWFNLTLDHDANWTSTYRFRIDAPGSWKMQWLLFRDGDFSAPYRSVHLFITVRSAGP